jgi:hypothetical protein
VLESDLARESHRAVAPSGGGGPLTFSPRGLKEGKAGAAKTAETAETTKAVTGRCGAGFTESALQFLH